MFQHSIFEDMIGMRGEDEEKFVLGGGGHFLKKIKNN
jgi:hypothetical protein